MNNSIIGLGEILFDCYPLSYGHYDLRIGGAPANYAYHAHALGANAIIISAIGNDFWGEKVSETLKAKGLTAILPVVSYETGIVDVIVRQGEENDYNIRQNAAWDNLVITPEIKEAVRHAKAICWGSLAQRSTTSQQTIMQLLKEYAPKDCLKIFDINMRQTYYSKEIVEQSLSLCNILKLNAGELNDKGIWKPGEIEKIGQLLGLPEEDPESRCKRLVEQFHLDYLLFTCGKNGSIVFSSRDPEPSRVTPEDVKNAKIKVVNTTGAGDSFTGAFCCAILKGMSVRDAHKLAFDVSSYVCENEESMPSIPNKYRERLK